jgi:hypothetical protein
MFYYNNYFHFHFSQTVRSLYPTQVSIILSVTQCILCILHAWFAFDLPGYAAAA